MREIFTKQSNDRETLEWDTNVTIKWQRNLRVREILKKKLNDREIFERAIHLRNNKTTEKIKDAWGTNETIKWRLTVTLVFRALVDLFITSTAFWFLGFWHCYSTFSGTCASTQVIGKSSRSPRLPLQIPWFVEVTFCLLAHNGKLIFFLIEQQAAVDTCTSTDKFLSKRAKIVKLVS